MDSPEVENNQETWKLLSKEGGNPSTETTVMEIPGAGCIVRVRTSAQAINSSVSIAESLVFVPWAKLTPTYDDENVPVGWKLISTGKF